MKNLLLCDVELFCMIVGPSVKAEDMIKSTNHALHLSTIYQKDLNAKML
jgi:hypothetical protein